jgi:hypothetical protein
MEPVKITIVIIIYNVNIYIYVTSLGERRHLATQSYLLLLLFIIAQFPDENRKIYEICQYELFKLNSDQNIVHLSY